MTTKSRGDRGEETVARYLEGRRYQVLDRQWRCRFGEIDLVARDREGQLCFVEVKLRGSVRMGLPRESVTGRKQQRLRLAAALYMSEREMDEPARFDVAEVYDFGGVLQVEYLENAFA